MSDEAASPGVPLSRIDPEDEFFRALCERLPAAVLLLQGDHIVYMNERAVKITGYTMEESIGKEFWSLARSDYRDLVRDRGGRGRRARRFRSGTKCRS